MAALEAGIGQINVESSAELETLNAVAGQLGVKADITIRVNPDIDAGTHAKITTGRKENKFGIDIDLAREAYRAGRPAAQPQGGGRGHAYRLAAHLARSLSRCDRQGARADRPAARRWPSASTASTSAAAWGSFMPTSSRPRSPTSCRWSPRKPHGLGCELTFEPGRRLVGEAGVLVSEVILVKPGVSKTFVIVDAAMNDLIRPTLYEAWHDILPVASAPRCGHDPL